MLQRIHMYTYSKHLLVARRFVNKHMVAMVTWSLWVGAPLQYSYLLCCDFMLKFHFYCWLFCCIYASPFYCPLLRLDTKPCQKLVRNHYRTHNVNVPQHFLITYYMYLSSLEVVLNIMILDIQISKISKTRFTCV